MKDPKPEIDAVLIVLRGDFNPAIIHPAWLAARDLIKEEEGETADLSVVSPEVSAFDVDWFSLRVTKDLFSAHSTDPSRYLALSDLVMGIFTFLEFTPLKFLGMNRRMHFRIESEERWHELGHLWAPKEPWKDVLIGGGLDELPGLRSLTIEGNREGSTAEYLRVKVEPSVMVKPGIYFETNEHYKLTNSDSALQAVETIGAAWADAQAFAVKVARHLLGGE